ncbi:hypothetical protein MaudCBS49596_005438 [Microsporum audouinii]
MEPTTMSREQLDDIWRRRGFPEYQIASMMPEERNLAILHADELRGHTCSPPQQQDQQPTAPLPPQLSEPLVLPPALSAQLSRQPISLSGFTQAQRAARVREQNRNAADRHRTRRRQAEARRAQEMRETQQRVDRYQRAYEMMLAAVNNSISSVSLRQLTAEQAMELLRRETAGVEASLRVDGG